MLVSRTVTKVSAASGIPTFPPTVCSAMPNRTIAVPSLNRLSPSTRVPSDFGVPRRLNVAMTATGSVAETIAPTTKASSSRSPVTRWSAPAMIAVVTSTPGMARNAIPPIVRRRLVMSVWKAASNTRPGRSTRRTSSGVTWNDESGRKTATPRPTRTSATVYGNPIRREISAMKMAAASRTMNSSTVSSVSSPITVLPAASRSPYLPVPASLHLRTRVGSRLRAAILAKCAIRPRSS